MLISFALDDFRLLLLFLLAANTACAYVCMYMCMYVCICMYIYVCMYVCMYMYVPDNVEECSWSPNPHSMYVAKTSLFNVLKRRHSAIRMYVSIHTHIYVHTYIHTYIPVWVFVMLTIPLRSEATNLINTKCDDYMSIQRVIMYAGVYICICMYVCMYVCMPMKGLGVQSALNGTQ